jgi:hypothetical protein
MLEVKRGKGKCDLCIFFCVLLFCSFSLFSFLMWEWAGTSPTLFTWGWMLISFLNVNIIDSSSTGFKMSASPHYKICCYFLLWYFKWHHTMIFSWRFKSCGMRCCVVGQVLHSWPRFEGQCLYHQCHTDYSLSKCWGLLAQWHSVTHWLKSSAVVLWWPWNITWPFSVFVLHLNREWFWSKVWPPSISNSIYKYVW